MNKWNINKLIDLFENEKETRFLVCNGSPVIGYILKNYNECVYVDESCAFGDIVVLPFSIIKSFDELK